MKKIILILTLLSAYSARSFCQQFTDSNLPIVVINTDGGVYIPDTPRVPATMKIIYRGPGERNYLSDQNNTLYLNYNGRISIEVRGSSSQALDKKPYGLTTLADDNVTGFNIGLLGMPPEHDWILNSLNFDPSCLRDYLCYNLSRRMGEYAPRTVYCEVIVNGDYRGLYILQEKIKADKNRVDIEKILPADNSLPDISGGYITKADKSNGDPVAWTDYSYYWQPVDYIHEWPNPYDATISQTNYIKGQFNKLATAAGSGYTSISNGYPSVIDIPSFIDFMLINELASNPDAYQYSTFFHKDRNGKLMAGPIWDLNLSFGNDLFLWGFDRSKTNVWQFNDNSGNNGSKFWLDLFNISTFRCYMAKRLNGLISQGQPFDPNEINALIDETVSQISEAVTRENQRWGTIGDYSAEIKKIKDFVTAREAWMTTNLGSFTGCDNIRVPRLVISKIMYSPRDLLGLFNADDLEFIEITNDNNSDVDMSGIYFSGTGFVYQFPYSSVMKANSSVYLASNKSVFEKAYGFSAFGQYTRHLSDARQKLVLSDAFGNVIDSVTYSDSEPWPYADGNGSFLQLANLSFDNSLPESWIASSFSPAAVNSPANAVSVTVSPNPVRSILTVVSPSEIISITLYDNNGRQLLTEQVNCETKSVDMSPYRPGLYFLRVETASGTTSQELVKQ